MPPATWPQHWETFIWAWAAPNCRSFSNDKGEPFFTGDYTFEYGKVDTLREGRDAAIITCGSVAWRAVEAADQLKKESLNVAVLNVACPKDIDRAAIKSAAATGAIITYEDHNVHTGLGSIIAGIIAEERLSTSFSKLGVTEYGLSGQSDTVYTGAGLGIDNLIAAVKESLQNK